MNSYQITQYTCNNLRCSFDAFPFQTEFIGYWFRSSSHISVIHSEGYAFKFM